MQNVLAKHNYEYVTMPVSMDTIPTSWLSSTDNEKTVSGNQRGIPKQDNHDNIYYDFVTK